MRKRQGGIFMWTRKELKTRAKIRFKANYWKSVLIGLILAFLIGGSGGGVSGFVSGAGSSTGSVISETENSAGEDLQDITDDIMYEAELDWETGTVTMEGDDELIRDTVAIMLVIVVMAIVVFVVCIIVIPLQVLIFNPLEVGCKRFFVKNLKEDAQAKEICYAFDNGYKNIIKNIFLRDLFTFLWSLLFLIPGIIKSYEYRMIPYLLGEHPQMERKEVFALSKRMMQGNKWRAFLLDLSFLGWYILDICTLGILGIFYVGPYEAQTGAALYEKLKQQ